MPLWPFSRVPSHHSIYIPFLRVVYFDSVDTRVALEPDVPYFEFIDTVMFPMEPDIFSMELHDFGDGRQPGASSL